jgi:hypothetical protein
LRIGNAEAAAEADVEVALASGAVNAERPCALDRRVVDHGAYADPDESVARGVHGYAQRAATEASTLALRVWSSGTRRFISVSPSLVV